jgi:hypothetical protein
MEHDITTQVVGVRQEPSRDGQSIKHIVSISGGTAADGTQYPAGDYVTFDPTLTGKAAAFQGGQADVRVEIKQVPKQRGGGVWTNYNISDIGAVGTLAPQAMPVQGGAQAQPVQAPAAQPTQILPNVSPQVHPALVGDEQRRSEENRRSAMHAATEYTAAMLAAGLIQHPDEAARTLQVTTESLVKYVTTGSFEAQVQVPPQTAEEVAAQVPGVTVGVPFDTTHQPEPAPAA